MTPSPEHMRLAIQVAIDGVRNGQGGPFGAVIARGDRVLASACNRVLAKNDPTAHAEIEAIRDACAGLASFSLEGCDLYATCEPCPMCLAAAHWARIARVYHACDRADAARAGFDDEVIGREVCAPPEGRQLALVRFLGDEGQAPFRAWQQKSDRVPY